MTSIDISLLEDYIEDCKESHSQLIQKYKCDWNDTVHDSFEIYNEKVEEICEEFTMIFNRIEDISKWINGNEKYINKADRLLNEVDSL